MLELLLATGAHSHIYTSAHIQGERESKVSHPNRSNQLIYLYTTLKLIKMLFKWHIMRDGKSIEKMVDFQLIHSLSVHFGTILIILWILIGIVNLKFNHIHSKYIAPYFKNKTVQSCCDRIFPFEIDTHHTNCFCCIQCHWKVYEFL